MLFNIVGGSGGAKPEVLVTAPTGSTVTASNATKSITGTEDSGTWLFKLPELGEWTITATDGEQIASQTVFFDDKETVSLAYFAATINVTYPVGSTCTCSDGQTTLNAPDTSGSYTFTVMSTGAWTITVTDGAQTASKAVEITEDGQSETISLSYVKIYGISRDITASSPEWARTDDAVGFSATASVGTVAGASSFDNCYPWNGIVRETLSTGDVMVKIPKFWYKRYREGNIEYIKIADAAVGGFTLHPAFNHAGVPKDCVYIGAYKTSSGHKSVTSASPLGSLTRSSFRSSAKNKGDGWGLIDIAANSAIQMLFLVEFATNDSQTAIGMGYCDGNTAAINTGSCDNVPNLTGRPAGTDGKVDVVYRGIEGIWGNISEFMDGLNQKGLEQQYMICTDPSKYADDTGTGYTCLSFNSPGTGYITEEGFDTALPWAMCPSAISEGSSSTFYTDYTSNGHTSVATWFNATRTGYWQGGTDQGLFNQSCTIKSTVANKYYGSRLLYIPTEG